MSILYHVNTVVALKLWFSKLQAEFLQLPLNYSFEKKNSFKSTVIFQFPEKQHILTTKVSEGQQQYFARKKSLKQARTDI